MEKTLETMLVKQVVLHDKVESAIDNGRKTKLEKRTAGFFKQKLIDLRMLWQEFLTQDRELAETILMSQEKCEHKYIAEQRFDKLEIKYSEYMGELEDGLKAIFPDGNSSMLHPEHHSAQLPKITLPKFSGEYNSWRSFYDLFTSLVHDNSQLQPVQKLHYLKGCLTGDAERLLRHTPITNQDYLPAWRKLKDRYENTRTLVNHHLKSLVNQSKLTIENAKSLKSLVDNTDECLQQLKALKVDTESWDALLIYLIVQKLPFVTLRLWEEELGDDQKLPQFKTFLQFLHTRIRVLESITNTMSAKPVTTSIKKESTQTYHSTSNNGCPACDKRHYVGNCTTFLNLDVLARRKIIKEAGRCLNCFSSKHTHNKCQNKNRCKKCQQLHHTTLHAIEPSSKGLHAPGQSNNSTAPNAHTVSFDVDRTNNFLVTKTYNALLPTALVVAHGRNGHSIKLRCLLDSGSQASFITESACKQLHIHSTHAAVEILGLNKNQTAFSRRQVQVQLESTTSSKSMVQTEMLVLKNITDLLPAREIVSNHWEHLKNLELADPTFWKPSPIDILLGANIYGQIVGEGIRRGPRGAPVAINTIFGWIILGSTSTPHNDQTSAFTISLKPIEELNKQIRKFWETEEVPECDLQSPAEKLCQEKYEASYLRVSNGKYQVRLPFIDERGPVLGESRNLALKRFEYLQRKLNGNSQLKQEYETCLDEYLELGHMTACDPPKEGEDYYYIPHHAVFKQSTTIKLRVVFDASARTTNGKSLNEQLLIGPTLQPKLFSIVLNWRKHQVAMTADIEKMYRMIWVHPEDRKFQRILWRDPKTNLPQDYQLNTVTFGTSSAPYLAIKTLQQLATDERERYPLAAEVTFTDFYVDDLLTGAETILEAQALQQQFIEMLSKGGFKLRKWSSNKMALLSHLSDEDKELKGSLNFQDLESIKTLGIRWYPSGDYFSFSLNGKPNHDVSTKRTILSEIASLYDPLGWISPIIIVAKILIQTLWINGYLWDSKVSQAIIDQWQTFKNELHDLEKLKIPRWIKFSSGNASQEIHGYCDASSKAYAAVLYLRTKDKLGNITATLLTSKTKVAPVKPITLPRLELNGALLLAQLIKTTIQNMKLQNTPIFAWTDSTIVLQWLRDHPARWKTYVANRVAEIQGILPTEHWNHVPTKDNPADLASRGTTTRQLLESKLWWHGPEWLIKNSQTWPKKFFISEQTELEAKKPTVTNLIAQYSIEFITNYSSYTKLIRITAIILRFMYNCRSPTQKQTKALSVMELNKAKITIAKSVQRSTLTDEYEQLRTKRPLSRKSRLLALNPFLDHDGLMRVGGRLENANIPYNTKHPIILPRDHHFSILIINKVHKETLHGGTALVLNTIRNQFWILDAKRMISTQIHKCVTCAKHRAAITQQLMGDLPAPRVNITRAFTHVGIDYAGPISLKMSKHRNAKNYKGYFCIFVCMATKAIHIEAASDLTTAGFLAALKRFVARRGLCSDIYSDCGTNFKGGKSVLDHEVRQAIKEASPDVQQYLANLNINWHFNPPAAPHHGGLWEAGIKSIKYHLRRVIGTTVCTFEEMMTLLTQIEACLNSRPLCTVRNEVDDLAVLTPGHFLIGQAINAVPEPNLTTLKVTSLQRWQHIQQMNQHFWSKWTKEYLNRLQQRPRWWQQQRQNLKIGDVILIKDENTPPTSWPIGIIKKVHPGKDGMVRVVTVRTRYGTYQRPVVKICRLPIETTEP